VVIAQVLATLRANVRYCDVRYLKTERGSECGVAKDDFDGGAMANASESGCDGAGGDDVICGGDVGGCGEVRDARKSWVLVRESRGHEDRGPSRRRAHGRWIGGGVEYVGCDYWVEQKGMYCRGGRCEAEERVELRQRLKCQSQSQAASLYRDAGDGEALSMDRRATCCDCASDIAHASSQHSPLLAISLLQPFCRAHGVLECLAARLWEEDFWFQVRLWLMTNGEHAIPQRMQYSQAKALALVSISATQLHSLAKKQCNQLT
jgi:hypothetical protein